MKRILVVDDSQFNLMVVQNALESEYEVNTCLSGLESIQFARSHPVDLILMDIEMPEFSGIETVKLLKKDARLAKIPIIFLTGVSNGEVEKTCLDLGARDFITKPFNEPVMMQRIKMVLELEDLQKNLQAQVLGSQIDPVTGLWNRRHLEEQVHWNWEKIQVAGALAVVDVDHFRLVNDAMNYEQGNFCLKVIGSTLKELLQEPELAARESADVFLIYLPEAEDPEEAVRRIENLCEEVERRLEENKFKGLTLSAGIAMIRQAEGSFGKSYYFAEKILHEIKVKGVKAIQCYQKKEE